MYKRDFATSEKFRLQAIKGLDRQRIWHANILGSRILRERGRLTQAAELATQVIKEAAAANETLCNVEANIALGEVRFDQGRLPSDDPTALHDAARLFQEALDQSQENLKIRAVCQVHLARVRSVLRDYEGAHRAMQEYESLKGRVEVRFVHDLAGETYRTYVERGDFVIRSSDSASFTHNHWENRLRRYLLTQAKIGAPNRSAVAKRLGISRPTLQQWDPQEPRPRREAASLRGRPEAMPDDERH